MVASSIQSGRLAPICSQPPVCLVMATTSWTVIPRPRFTPKVWLRDSGDMQVAIRSPTPARPEKVAGSAPMEPPAAWFGDPGMDSPTPLTITSDVGRGTTVRFTLPQA